MPWVPTPTTNTRAMIKHVEGECEHHVHDPHHDRVQPAAEITADRADEHAEAEREQDGQHADLQVGAPAVQDA